MGHSPSSKARELRLTIGVWCGVTGVRPDPIVFKARLRRRVGGARRDVSTLVGVVATAVYTAPVFTVLTTDTFDHWRAGLRDRQARMRITARLKRVEQGNLGDAKSVGGGVSELRIAYGPGYRLYFTRRGLELIVLLCGGAKSTQAQDVKAAQAIALQLEES